MSAVLVVLVVVLSVAIAAFAYDTKKNFVKALEASEAARQMENSLQYMIDVNKQTRMRNDVIKLWEKALSYAKRTSKMELNKWRPGLGDQFYELFIPAHELIVDGYESQDSKMILGGDRLLHEWKKHYGTDEDQQHWSTR